ncbi:nuclear receptor subfamily 0 group B member [Acrasis kona]|uniref:Nuclear receptor subfamily 0 group B member n=1 Tax=Acrasis kona TaxID=1008807 RepID=A0AAW2Z1H7_9EUKA
MKSSSTQGACADKDPIKLPSIFNIEHLDGRVRSISEPELSKVIAKKKKKSSSPKPSDPSPPPQPVKTFKRKALRELSPWSRPETAMSVFYVGDDLK